VDQEGALGPGLGHPARHMLRLLQPVSAVLAAAAAAMNACSTRGPGHHAQVPDSVLQRHHPVPARASLYCVFRGYSSLTLMLFSFHCTGPPVSDRRHDWSVCCPLLHSALASQSLAVVMAAEMTVSWVTLQTAPNAGVNWGIGSPNQYVGTSCCSFRSLAALLRSERALRSLVCCSSVFQGGDFYLHGGRLDRRHLHCGNAMLSRTGVASAWC
jgi:hypothetical protein